MIPLKTMNLFSRSLRARYLKPAFFLLLALYIFSLFGRVPDIDDAWVGEPAYWLANDGVARSELMRGVNFQEQQLVVHHKLLTITGASFIKTFGFSLYSLKTVSLFYFIFFVAIFILYTRNWKHLFSRDDVWLALIILFVYPWIFKYSFLFRPEVMAMTLGFIAYLFLERYLESEKYKTVNLFLSGIFLGLTVAAHLNGLVLAASAVVLLLWNKKFKALFPIGVGFILAFSIYFYDLISGYELSLWKEQFFNSPALDTLGTGPVWIKPVFNLLDEHMRYFHNYKIIVFSVFLIVTLTIGFRFLAEKHTSLLRFALLVALFTGIIAMHKSRQYILLDFPYLIILITLTLKAIKEKRIARYRFGNAKFTERLIGFLCLLFVLSSLYFDILLSVKKFSPAQNKELTEKYAGANSHGMNIVAPMTFIFNEIEDYNSIQSDLCYVELQKTDPAIKGEGFFKKANDFDISLIMVSDYNRKLLGLTNYHKGDTIAGFRVIDNNPEMIVCKKINGK